MLWRWGLYFSQYHSSCFDTVDERDEVMCAKVVWLTLESKHWKQNLAVTQKTCYPNDLNSLWVIQKAKNCLAWCTF